MASIINHARLVQKQTLVTEIAKNEKVVEAARTRLYFIAPEYLPGNIGLIRAVFSSILSYIVNHFSSSYIHNLWQSFCHKQIELKNQQAALEALETSDVPEPVVEAPVTAAPAPVVKVQTQAEQIRDFFNALPNVQNNPKAQRVLSDQLGNLPAGSQIAIQGDELTITLPAQKQFVVNRERVLDRDVFIRLNRQDDENVSGSPANTSKKVPASCTVGALSYFCSLPKEAWKALNCSTVTVPATVVIRRKPSDNSIEFVKGKNPVVGNSWVNLASLTSLKFGVAENKKGRIVAGKSEQDYVMVGTSVDTSPVLIDDLIELIASLRLS